MTTAAVVTMVVMLTLVWGGFATAVGVALYREKRKRRTAGRPDEQAAADD